jgi:GNAT superfamily N-acetyltransferase
MKAEVLPVPVDEIVLLRDLYRQEMSCQIVHDSFARRGFSDAYLLRVDGHVAGYGLVANKHYPDTVHEFYTLPVHRAAALPMFRRLLEVSGAARILAQTNDRLLLLMLYDCAAEITSDVILFADAFSTRLSCPAGSLRPVAATDRERLLEQKLDGDARWMIESEGVPVAAGDALFHYNPPYGDIYMAVHEAYRQRGFGSYLIQELKRICYETGKIPAARCNVSNMASRKTLEKAGLLPCARVLEGEVMK